MLHAFRHADTPKWIKGVMLGVVVYLFSPIDLIPDFLVLFGITDDLVVLSAAMWFLGKAIPEHVKQTLPVEPVKPASRSALNTRTIGVILMLLIALVALLNSDWFQIQMANMHLLN